MHNGSCLSTTEERERCSHPWQGIPGLDSHWEGSCESVWGIGLVLSIFFLCPEITYSFEELPWDLLILNIASICGVLQVPKQLLTDPQLPRSDMDLLFKEEIVECETTVSFIQPHGQRPNSPLLTTQL